MTYRLDLTIDPAKERFSGHVEIDAVLAQSSAVIDLHGRDLAMHRVAAVVAGRTANGTWRQLDDTGVSRLTFAQPLPAGTVTLVFDYDAAFSDGPSGLFRVKVGDEWYVWSQFESIDARAAFPSFDQPGFKVPFTVTMRTPPGLVAVSNARETGKTLDNGLEVHRFEPSLPLPTYLVALMTGPFAVAESEVPPTPQRPRPLPLRIISPRPNARQLTYALEGSKAIVAHLEDYFGEPFPFPKLDQITTPILPGAMENAGADLYQDAILILDQQAEVTRKRRFGMVVSHELSHQWFGDLVTPAWWDDIWLNESFANWMGYRIGEKWQPDLNIAAGALAEGFAAMETDALAAGRPIRQNIESNSQIDAAFDSITYGKGGHVVAMIAAYMGDDRFRDGVRRYMAAHRYGNASSADFFAAMADAAGDPRIVPAMRSFTDQQGVPLLTFTPEGKGWHVTQSRYAPLGTEKQQRVWGIPLCLRQGKSRQCELLTDADMHVNISGSGPLMPNAGGTGYYRFELPEKEWNRLIKSVQRLPGGEAQALSDSLDASFQAGHATIAQLADLAERLARHPDSYASAAAMEPLTNLASSGIIGEKGLAGFRRLVARIYAPVLEQNGFDPRANAYRRETPEKVQQRSQAVARLVRTVRHPDLVKVLGNAARAWLGGNAQALDPAWFGLAFDIHVAQGGLAAATDLAARALTSQAPVFRPAVLETLSSSGKQEIAVWLLNDFTDQRLRRSERINLLRGIMQSSDTRELGYRWLLDHLDELMGGGGGIFFSARLPQMLNGFCTVEKADGFARDLRQRLAGKPAALELERTIERVRNCGLLKQAREKEATEAAARLR